MIRKLMCSATALVFGFQSVSAQNLADPAAAFGARPSIESISLSPDGSTISYVQPARGQGSYLFATPLATCQSTRTTAVDGTQRLGGCDFVSATRLVCTIWAIRNVQGFDIPFSRIVAINADGSGLQALGQTDSTFQTGIRTFSGSVIDWLPGTTNTMLMQQSFIPEQRPLTRLERRRDGLGVVRVDTTNNRSNIIEEPRRDIVSYISDGRGQVRMIATRSIRGETCMDTGIVTYFYRRTGSSEWTEFGRYNWIERTGVQPEAVDPDLNVAYSFEPLNGRQALYRVSLDGSMRRELVASHDQVDVDGLIRIGRRNRVVGVSYATERREGVYFDTELQAISARLRRALPNLPQINFVDASEDENILLIRASSDTDPGRYYTYERASRRLAELMLVRPELENVTLSPMRAMTYRAADGTNIPAYLTLPPGRTDARGLPAIVMPHGGPGARDEWGFDYLVQYFAHRGYAVLQPNFRGSAGYGNEWFQRNGFQSWRVAVGDVNDAGRWLLSQGVAADKLAVFGWSYGGYAALQSGVLDPALFRAIVAVAPVTDLPLLRESSRFFSDFANMRDFLGSGPHLTEGSPARNAGTIRAPVLMFHGNRDINVPIRQAEVMNSRLREAGRTSELITYPGLDHQLEDSTARADMLRRSDAFLRQALGITAP